MDFERVSLTAQGAVAVLALNDPESLNAIGRRVSRGISDALNEVENPNRRFRALLFTAQGRAFCSGANLAEPPDGGEPIAAGAILDELYHPLLRRLRDLKIPVVTAVNGVAAGVGMSFALMGDIVVAARSAYFVQAFARIGLVPDGGSTWVLPRLIGLARARELSLLAEKLTADKALEWGLINRVFEDDSLMSEGLAIAQQLADGPTTALALTRRLYWDSSETAFEQQLARERAAQDRAAETDDFREGIRAFREKRPPQFNGR